jgi:RNase P subunit RPR2
MRRIGRDYRPEIRVWCKECKEWIEESKTTFVDISEDIQGKDLLTFKCPTCHTEQQSHRIA